MLDAFCNIIYIPIYTSFGFNPPPLASSREQPDMLTNRQGNHVPINFLSKAHSTKLKLIQGDSDTFSDVLTLINEYEGEHPLDAGRLFSTLPITDKSHKVF